MKRKEFYEYVQSRQPREIKAIVAWAIVVFLFLLTALGPYVVNHPSFFSIGMMFLFLWGSAYSLRFFTRLFCGEINPRFTKCPYCQKNIAGQFYSQTITTGICHNCKTLLFDDEILAENDGQLPSRDEFEKSLKKMIRWDLLHSGPVALLTIAGLGLFIVKRINMASPPEIIGVIILVFLILGLGIKKSNRKVRELGLCCPHCDKKPKMEQVPLMRTTHRCPLCGGKVISEEPEV